MFFSATPNLPLESAHFNQSPLLLATLESKHILLKGTLTLAIYLPSTRKPTREFELVFFSRHL